uniref:Uncharacterized protein n=1 Tax=Medicago truncatula TaxID=3880 RepID=Q2HS19_MEDTR|nr:hypothetical protein MtrDRAFT_AC157504g14v2 [Medicago truncatula]
MIETYVKNNVRWLVINSSLCVPPVDAPTVVALVAVSIDHREKFTTKRKFPTHNDLLEWVENRQGS